MLSIPKYVFPSSSLIKLLVLNSPELSDQRPLPFLLSASDCCFTYVRSYFSIRKTVHFSYSMLIIVSLTKNTHLTFSLLTQSILVTLNVFFTHFLTSMLRSCSLYLVPVIERHHISSLDSFLH